MSAHKRSRKAFLVLSTLLSVALLVLLGSQSFASAQEGGGAAQRCEALVLVDSQSADYGDFAHLIQPYLENFGVPYTVCDIASSPLPADLDSYSLLIIGHRQLDLGGTYLTAAEQEQITAAVNGGTGLVNFDNDLWTAAGTARYSFLQSIFNFSPGGETSGSGVSFSAPTSGSAPSAVRIDCCDAAHQDPALPTTTSVADLEANIAADQWTDFQYGRPFASAMASIDETDLPVMHFYASVPNGQYTVSANLYTQDAGRDMRYYYGYSPDATSQYFVDTVGGSSSDASQHSEYRLGTVTVSDGSFDLYAQSAALLPGASNGYPIFGWAWIDLAPTGAPPPPALHYIVADHARDETIATASMQLAGMDLPATATAVAYSGAQPLVAVTSYGAGQAVQWGSYDWARQDVLGPVHGLDDLVWRSLVWAARKPFVMQALPAIVTLRVDDAKGPFAWAQTAATCGYKPWIGLFFQDVTDSDAADLSALTQAGQATAAVHAFNDTDEDGSFFYFNRPAGEDYPDAEVAANFATATAWFAAHDIPISTYVLPHYYEFGTNVFGGLQAWGVEFVGTVLEPGTNYGAPWLEGGPYRSFATGASDSTEPLAYADFLTVPGHPEFAGVFFNCLTEIRDQNGYEWGPSNDVATSVTNGTQQLKRAFDSRVLGTLFTHEYNVEPIASAHWQAILQGINANIAAYQPLYLTMDEACQYVRALATSQITPPATTPPARRCAPPSRATATWRPRSCSTPKTARRSTSSRSTCRPSRARPRSIPRLPAASTRRHRPPRPRRAPAAGPTAT